jgi:hypothetical protein
MWAGQEDGRADWPPFVTLDWSWIRNSHWLFSVIKRKRTLGTNFDNLLSCGPGSSVGIATDYGLDGPGIESRWGRDFSPVQTGPGAHPASCTMGTGSFPGVKCGRSVLLTTPPLLTRGVGRVELYLYSLLGHNRACNGVTLPLYIYIYMCVCVCVCACVCACVCFDE